MNYVKTYAVSQEDYQLNDMNGYILKPENKRSTPLPTLIFYHGWTSNIDKQLFRATLIAAWGYQVVLPEVILHGKRGALTDEGIHGMVADFYRVIDQTILEYPALRDYLIDKHNANPNKIAVSGHSMGGFTASGLMAHYNDICCGISFNGSACWKQSMEESLQAFLNFGTEEEFYKKGKEYQADPYDLIDNFRDRPFLMTNGMLDKTVPSKANELFYHKAQLLYADKSKIQHFKLAETGHIVTDEMLRLQIEFLFKYMAVD